MSSSLNKRQIYIIIFSGFLLMFFSSSVKNVFQVWFIDICTSFGISRSEFSLSGITFMLVTGIGAWIAGMTCDRFGVRKTIIIGNSLIAVSFIGSAFIANFYFFVALYGGLSALALAAVQYVPMGILVEQTFSGKNKGLIYAFLVNGTGLGFVILSPLWVFLNLSFSWQEVYIAVGIFFLLVMTPMFYFVLPVDEKPTKPIPAIDDEREENFWRGILSNPAFWFISLSFFGCGVNMAFIDIHFVPLMQDQKTTPTIISSSLSMLGVLEIVGGFAAGWLTGRIKPAFLLSGFYSLRAISGWVLMQSTDDTALIIFSVIFGATYLGTIIVTSLFTLQYFGKKNKGTVFGLVFFIHQIGAALSTWAGAYIFDKTDSYYIAVVIATGFSVFSAVIALTLFSCKPQYSEQT